MLTASFCTSGCTLSFTRTTSTNRIRGSTSSTRSITPNVCEITTFIQHDVTRELTFFPSGVSQLFLATLLLNLLQNCFCIIGTLLSQCAERTYVVDAPAVRAIVVLDGVQHVEGDLDPAFLHLVDEVYHIGFCDTLGWVFSGRSKLVDVSVPLFTEVFLELVVHFVELLDGDHVARQHFSSHGEEAVFERLRIRVDVLTLERERLQIDD